ADVLGRGGQEQEAARARILQKEQDHTHYRAAFYHRRPRDSHLYDLVLNTGSLDLESAGDVISSVLERKAKRLSVPEQDLGPAEGLSRYPGQPEDFHPSKEDLRGRTTNER